MRCTIVPISEFSDEVDFAIGPAIFTGGIIPLTVKEVLVALAAVEQPEETVESINLFPTHLLSRGAFIH